MKKFTIFLLAFVALCSLTLEVIAAPPTLQARYVGFTNAQSTSVTVSWINGNGTNRIAVAAYGGAANWTAFETTFLAAITNINTVVDANGDFNVAFASSTNKWVNSGITYVIMDRTTGQNRTSNFTNLTPNTQYHVKVYEFNLNGNTPQFNYNNAFQNPRSFTPYIVTPPTGLSMNYVCFSGGQIAWTTDGANAAGYYLKVTDLSTNTIVVNSLDIGLPVSKTYTITGLNPSTNYKAELLTYDMYFNTASSSASVTFTTTGGAPSISGLASVCAFTTGVTYTVSPSFTTYFWTVSGGTIVAGQGTNTLTVDWGAGGPGTVSVAVTDGSGCTGNASYSVTVHPLPNPPISGSTSVCANTTGVTYSISGTYASINWTCSGGTIVGPTNMASITVNWGAAGVGNVTVNVTDLNGCSGSTVLPVTKNALPTPSITGPANVCDSQTGVVYSVGAFSSYSWTVVGGTIVAGQNTSSITVDWGGAGTGSVSVSVTNVNGCVGTHSINVTKNALPTITLGANPSVCQGTTTANLPYSATTGTPTQYTIDYSSAANGVGFVDVGWTALPASPIILSVPPAAPAGVYNATLKVRSALLCESTIYNFTVTVEATPVAGTLTKSPNVATVCAGTGVSATLTAGTGGSGTDETQYSTNAGSTWTTYTSGTTINTSSLSGTNVVQIRTRRLGTVCPNSAWNTVMWSVEATPVAPTITKSPNNTSVCETASASATFTGGSGGSGTNTYEYRTSANNGATWTAWTAYTPGNPIAAAGLTNIEIRATRNATACTPATNTVSWTVEATPVAGTLTKSPNVATVCAGTGVSATLTAGTGGSGTDETQYSTNAGSTWTTYTSGTTINTSSLSGTNVVQIRTRRLGTVCPHSAWNTVMWSVEATPVAPTITKSPNTVAVCATGSVSATFTGGSGGSGTNTYEYRTSANNGATWTAWTAYTPGNPIAAAGLTNIEIRATRNATACTPATNTVSWTVEATPIAQTINKSPNTASVCAGTPVSATFTGGSGGNGTNTYEYRYNGTGAWSAYTPGSNLSTTGYNLVEIRTTRNADNCTPATATVSWTINAIPTITLGTNPSVCAGSTPAQLTYSATSGGANQYTIDFDAAANTAGFVDVGWTALPASPIAITVPVAAPAGTYNGVLKVRNSVTGCESNGYNISVNINALPTITLGSSPTVCQGTTTANLPYTAITESPTQYKIDFNFAAEAQGFNDVPWTTLPSSPISITVPPGAAVGTYNATLQVKNANGCISTLYNFTVTVVAPPSITGHPSNVSSGVGSNVSFSVTASNATSYQWYYDTDNSGYDGTPISGATNATLNLNNIQYSDIGYYYCEAINAGCGNVFSNYASLTVYPATQVSGIYFTARSKNTITIQFTAGSGDAHIIAVKQSNSIPPTTPTNNTSYTANTQFPLGSDLGNNAYVILNGTATNVTVTNLAQNTAYYFRGFTYANYGSMILYNPNTATNNPKIIYTTPRETDFAVVGDRYEMNTISPNPVRDELTFDLYAPVAESVKIEILSLNGEALWSGDYRLGEGYNTISFYLNNLPVRLAAGTYILRVNGSESLTQKFIYMP